MKIHCCVAAGIVVLSLCACAADPQPAPAASNAPTPDAAPAAVPGPARSDAIAVPPADADVASGVAAPIELPSANTPTAPLAENADIVYRCEDGSDLRVTYSGGRANITLPDGSIATAPASAAASTESGGEVFVGNLVGLRRIGAVVELQQDGMPPRRCREADGNA